MKNYIVTLILFLVVPASTVKAYSGTLEERMDSLDKHLGRRKEYDAKKESVIKECKERLSTSRSDMQRYRGCIRLYEEYKAYKFDSAYHYANRSLQLANRMANREYKVEAGCAMTFCLLSAGLYKEAFDRFETVCADSVSDKYRILYYKLAIHLNYSIADYNHAKPYHDQYVGGGNVYTDSLLTLLKPESGDWWYIVGQRQMKQYDYNNSIQSFKKAMEIGDIDTHTKAIVTSCIGWMNWQQERLDEAMEYLAEAAKCDVMASVKETTALRGLAELLYMRGDISRSDRYVQMSLKDANFYGARQRKIEVGTIMPIIEQGRYRIMETQRNTLIITVAVVSLLIVAILALLLSYYREKRKLQEAHSVIAESNRELKIANTRLHEANKIKNEYIGNSFYVNSEFIDRLEKLYRMIDHKIHARQYEDLRYTLKEATLAKERGNMFAAFDATFLKIYPTFVEQYNSLFPEEERKSPEKGHLLTTEQRIYALIRLGVTESERIAKFLKYSVHTINTYKTRIKNKSLVEREQFEARIMMIGGEE